MSIDIYTLLEKYKDAPDYRPVIDPADYKEYDGPELDLEGATLIGWGGKTPTSWEKGHVPWNKGIPNPEASKRMKEYWVQWRKDNPPKPKVKVYKGYAHDAERRSAHATGLNTKNIECEHCGKVANTGNYNRWHGDRCKWKE